MASISMEPVGIVHSTRKAVEDDDWDREEAYVEVSLGAEAVLGLETFSHVEVLFLMDQVEPAKIETGARHPRNNPDWPKVGIFAQRGKNRPNRIGLSICRVKRVEGARVHVEGLDAVDGTPVLDLKPWVAEFAPRGEVRQPAWMTELMRGYWS